jgi:protein-tyrosine phosphatase
MPEMFRVAALGDGFLGIMGMPGIHESLRETFDGLARLGVDVVVSLLQEPEALDLGLAGEQAACESAGLEFLSFPIEDRGQPSDPEAVSQFSRRAHARIISGCGFVFHCRAGIGRSGMMTASVLLHQGLTVREAFARISAARGLINPDTPGQLEWVESNYAILVGTT